MTSTPERLRLLVALAALVVALFALAVQGCGLERPPDPPGLDCDAIDRAEERFPDECGDPVDAGEDEDAGASEDDASEDDAG